jgi:hypothetical protein
MLADTQPLITALQNHLQVNLTYLKETSGEIVNHVVGIYEIGPHKTTGKATLWGWDVNTNDRIRNFIIDNIQSIQVLEVPFIPNGAWPLKLNGEVIP